MSLPTPSEAVLQLIEDQVTRSDPREVVDALLDGAAALSQVVVAHGKSDAASLVMIFASHLANAINPKPKKEESGIVLADATGRVRRS